MPLSTEDLRERLRRLTSTAVLPWGVVSSGLPALDSALPAGGFRRGTLVEWLADSPGSGTTRSALHAAGRAIGEGRPLVVVDARQTFHPPGIGSAIDWSQVLLVRASDEAQAYWAVDQALGTSGVGAVLTFFDRDDERKLRRWQLSAERSGVLGLIVRRLDHPPTACFSDLRIRVTPLSAVEGRLVRLELLRSRQGGVGAVVTARLDDDAHPLSDARTLVEPRKLGRA